MARWATRLALCVALHGLLAPVSAQTVQSNYVQAEVAFSHLTLDQKLKLQVLLTAAGYWPAVPDADFSARLFNAILRFPGRQRLCPAGYCYRAAGGSPFNDCGALSQLLEI